MDADNPQKGVLIPRRMTIKDHQADNAALIARIKELEEVYERLEQQALKDRKLRNEAQSDADLWRFSVDMGDHPSLLVKVWKQREALESKLAAAEEALEPFADHANDRAVDDTGWRDKETVKIVVSIGDLRKARAVLGGKPS